MKFFRFFSVLVVISLPATSFALEPGFYIGGSFGNTDVETGVTAVSPGINIDEEDSGFKILFGKKINKNAAVEIAYVDLGEASVTGNAGDIFSVDGLLLQFLVNGASISVEASTLAVSGVFSGNVGADASIFGRVGLAMWDTEGTASGGGITEDLGSEDGTDIFFGAGFQYDVTQSVGLRVEYELYDIDDDDVTMLSVGAIARF